MRLTSVPVGALLIVVTLAAMPARAQALAPLCYTPARDGWSGPSESLGCSECCNCTGPVSIQWSTRTAAAGWTGNEPIEQQAGRFVNRPFVSVAPQHLSDYCLRVRFSDASGPGQWGPTDTATCGASASDLCFTWDDAPPSAPEVLDASVISNVLSIDFLPSSDDGGGVSEYRLQFPPALADAIPPYGVSAGSPIGDVLGEGEWDVVVTALDRSENRSDPSQVVHVVMGSNALLPVAAAPQWAQSITGNGFVEITWPDDGADSWLVTQQADDGGWFISSRPHLDATTALLNAFGPCRHHRARVARVVGTLVSAWSTPSPDLLSDMIDPIAGAPFVAAFDGGTARIEWPTANDACPSGLSYELSRSINGGAYLAQTTQTATSFDEPVTVEGVWRWRLRVVDGAGNADVSPVEPELLVILDAGVTVEDAGVADAGVADAGMPDAGPVDAGQPDAGIPDGGTPFDGGMIEPPKPRQLGVGCGCSSVEAWVVLALALLRRRR